MKLPANTRRVLLIVAILLPLAALFIFTAFRSGPLAPVDVTVAGVENRAISPALSGIGTVEARYRFKIGPTRNGRLATLGVDIGDTVKKGQLLGTMDPVDLGELIASQQSKVAALESHVAMARSQVAEAEAQQDYAASKARRNAVLLKTRATSREDYESAVRNQLAAQSSLETARSAVRAASGDLAAARAALNAVVRQKEELTLLAPVDGLVVERRIEPGSTAVGGETVLEMIDPGSLWIELRVNQLESAGLRAGLPARVTLRSRPGESLAGRVLRVEPLADAVTEELLAKVVFTTPPASLPPLGELVEVDIDLPAGPATPVVPAAAIHLQDGRAGVWIADENKPRFAPIRTGRRSANGMIQVLDGLQAGEAKVIVHSARAISRHTRLHITESLTP
ncbi:MAG: efflux RND transporter periplasmic adaptor subunit [Akkermansiaceae bacterium]|nr:efflux RND transporter periplasmic adaptor subunit [Akkermansiaceae bacterium]